MSSPYYPGTDPITPNLLLELWGMDEIVAQDFIKIDEAFGSISSNIEVNGVPVSNPNFVDSATAVFSVIGSDISITASGGTGTVTSFSSGDLSPLFTTSVATATTTPALTFSLSTQSANQVFAGPISGSAAAPTFRSLVAADIPSLPYIANSLMTTLGDILYENATPAPARLAGNTTATKMYLSQTGNGSISAVPAWAQINYADITGTTPTPPSGAVLWSALGNAGGSLTLANGTNATEFDQTSAVIWSWKNKTAATGTLNQSSPVLELAGRYYSGSDAEDNWTIQNVVANGTNKLAQLVFTHTGTSGPAQIAVPATAGSASTPSLVLGSSLNTGGTYGPGFLCPSAGSIGFHPGDSSSSNVGLDLRFYRISSGTPTYSFDMQSASASAGGLILSCQENANTLQQIILASVSGSAAGVGIVLGGNGGNNGKDFSATSGTQVAVSIGASSIGTGRVTFDPTSGSASFVGLQVAPTINQTASASGSYTALLVNPTETAVLGTANKLLDLQVGGTSKFSVDNTGKATVYAGTATVGSGTAPILAKIDLTAQTAAIANGTALYSVPANGAGLYRVTCYAKITTASDISSTLGGAGGFTLTWTDPTDSTTPTAVTFSDTSSQSLTGNTPTTVYVTSAVVACKASTNLQYGFGYTDSHTSTAMAYKISVKVEYLG